MARYTRPEEGEWVQPVRSGYRMACCDCGLVHRMDFRVQRGRVQFRAFRAERSTAAMRRHKRRNMAKPNKKAPLGQGGRFAAVEQAAARSGARNPAAVAAAAGRKKYGAAKMAKLAAAGRRAAK